MTLPIEPSSENSQFCKIGQIISYSERNINFSIKLFTNETDFDGKSKAFLIYLNGQFVPFFIKKIEKTGTLFLQIVFDELLNSTQAKELLQKDIYVETPVIHKKNTEKKTFKTLLENPKSIVGFLLKNQQGKTLGQISNYYKISEQVLLSLQINGKECLVPFIKEFFISIEDGKKILNMEILEGLIDC
ncbi:MAG: hypothetical protein A3H98_01210 [Bacteroidetes bacterium RIFCSPLOWO2_02_FULL_36_8]|nr:MAG: hypothetical protein A3H98_01210 [Bacteroidetes bacterium RIFCSPLOWO2_02_FULL_36_8]OFY71698.1 MAG: hypothetical protein A3G23_03885 [Bacteroidetes bacterium RIFCSPLOWO2_12_FULL_37_12]